MSFVSWLFNKGKLTIQNAIEYGTKGCAIICEDGKVTDIFYESEDDEISTKETKEELDEYIEKFFKTIAEFK